MSLETFWGKFTFFSAVIILIVLFIFMTPKLKEMQANSVNYDKERKGVLTEMTRVEGETRHVMVGKTMTTVKDPDYYILKFDHQFRYEVSEEVAYKLEKGMKYHYQPEVNGSRIKISVKK